MNLTIKIKIYVALIIFLSIPVLIVLAHSENIPDIKFIAFWAILALITESLGISLPNGVGISVTFAISLASIIVGGPFMATIVTGLGTMFRVVREEDCSYSHFLNTPLYKSLFNTSQIMLATGLSAYVYITSGGIVGRFSLLPTLIVMPVFMLLNSAILAQLFSLIDKQSFTIIWLSNIKNLIPSIMAVGTLGIIIALAYISYGYGAVLLFFGPLLLARFSFKMYQDMRNIYIGTIKALNKSMEAKDSYTSGHASRVQEYAVLLANAAGLSDTKVQNIRTAAILHDIGKIGIDDNILKKPLKLTNKEYEIIQRHPVIGAEILKDVAFLRETAEIIRHHHERYDGKGYPDGLKGEEIPVEAAILSIADVYDAMTSNRPYRKSLDRAVALNEIKVNAGTQFHPDLAVKFLEVMDSWSFIEGEVRQC